MRLTIYMENGCYETKTKMRHSKPRDFQKAPRFVQKAAGFVQKAAGFVKKAAGFVKKAAGFERKGPGTRIRRTHRCVLLIVQGNRVLLTRPCHPTQPRSIYYLFGFFPSLLEQVLLDLLLDVGRRLLAFCLHHFSFQMAWFFALLKGTSPSRHKKRMNSFCSALDFL